MNLHDYLKVSEAAQLLRVDKKTIYREIHSGRLPAVEVCGTFRIARTDLSRRLAYKPHTSVTTVRPLAPRPVGGEFGRRARA
jgi:excisionase family DNA binding protein